MAGVSQIAVTTFVPLVFTVVAQLGALARSAGSGGETLRGRPPVLLPDGSRLVPALGRMNVLHAVNVALLANAFVLVRALDDGLLQGVLTLLVAVVWAALPLVEVDEYGDVLDAGCYPTSLYYHAITTLSVVAYLDWHVDPGVVRIEYDLLALDWSQAAGNPDLHASLGLAALLAASVLGYLNLLHSDLAARDAGRSRLRRLRDRSRHDDADPPDADSG